MTDELASLLGDIREQQRLQLERSAQSLQHQQESLALQREQFELYRQQLTRVERINDRAEAIQSRAGKAAKLVLWVFMPAIAVAIAALIGLMYLRGWR